jgi:hypothetical protein
MKPAHILVSYPKKIINYLGKGNNKERMNEA